MYYEDVDLNFKVKKAGYKVVSVPQAKITHLEGKSMKGGDEEEKQWRRDMKSAESQAVFLTNHYSKSYALFLLNLGLTNIRLKGAILSIIGKKSSGNARARRMNEYIKKLVEER